MSLLDIPWFYCPGDLPPGQSVRCGEEEWQHAKVLRLKPGDPAYVMNGAGLLAQGSIIDARKHLVVMIESIAQSDQPTAPFLTLLVAPTKNMARFEWVIEKAVEVGVTRVIPLACERSERVHLKRDRLDRIALSAAKQSHALFLPRIEELTPFAEAMVNTDQDASRWIAHCLSGPERAPIGSLLTGQNVWIGIGPEGDFSLAEVAMAEAAGFRGITLGDKRLRTETAAIAACIAVNLLRP